MNRLSKASEPLSKASEPKQQAYNQAVNPPRATAGVSNKEEVQPIANPKRAAIRKHFSPGLAHSAASPRAAARTQQDKLVHTTKA